MSRRCTLYGADFSLYSGKIRSYLRKKGIPFDEVLTTISVFKKFIIPRTGVRYIPVVQTADDQVFQDTTVIIDELEQRFPEHSVYPISPKQKLVSLLLEVYADEWLVIPAMHYRWAYQEVNQPFIFEKFGGLVSPKLPRFIGAWAGKKIASRFKGLVPLLGIREENIPAIEESYLSLLADLEQHFQNFDYLLGSRPCIADFGFIGPLYAHLYQDPYPGELMRQRAPSVVKWVERMIDDKQMDGALLADDQIPQTLLPILKRMANEQLPVLLDTDRRLGNWKQHNSGVAIPRTIGEHEFTLGGVTAMRVVMPYALWMFKRPVDFYADLNETTKMEVDHLLDQIGFTEALQQGLQNSLVRLNNKLEFAP